ncbi:MAG: glycosyltransferase family 2 protein [Candidatus Sericytochromatia bacterium]|nr:glycosyltransferase family 2 protein [Candidatus Sericytochromatia bacterium]
MHFTVAIPTYNRADFLKINIENILKQIRQTKSNGELLIVDDGSTDQTQLVLENYHLDNKDIFRYIISPINQGIAKTRNILVKQSQGKYIIFIDSDVFPIDNLIQNHLDVLKENIICQGNLLLTYDIKNLNKKFNPLTDYSRAYFDTANVSISRSKIIEAGYFDEKFSKYGWEDLELGMRLKKMGLKLIRKKNIYAYHYQPKINLNSLQDYLDKEESRALGAIYFYQKHHLLAVKLMAQLTIFHYLLDVLLNLFFGFEKEKFKIYLENLEKKNYNKFVPIFRMYMSHYYIKKLKLLVTRN